MMTCAHLLPSFLSDFVHGQAQQPINLAGRWQVVYLHLTPPPPPCAYCIVFSVALHKSSSAPLRLARHEVPWRVCLLYKEVLQRSATHLGQHIRTTTPRNTRPRPPMDASQSNHGALFILGRRKQREATRR
eukprot:scaffold1880_cov115-Isochrysis_galbana.AAC.2